MVKASLHSPDPIVLEVSRSLPNWPDRDLLDLAGAVARERLRRQLPEPVAVPICDFMATLEMSAFADA